MDTKTRKQEALYILNIIDRNTADAEFMADARRQYYELIVAQGIEKRAYLENTDDCFRLPLVNPYSWLLEYPNIYAKIMANDLDDIYKTVALKGGRTMPIAMNRVWWTVQPD